MRGLKSGLQAFAVAILLSAAHRAEAAAPPRWVEVAGYQVDMSRIPESQSADTVTNLEHQIGIVESTRLPPEVQAFFRTLKIMVDPSLAGMNGQNNQVDGQWVIRARPGKWPSDRAILLHEFLHAYQREVLGRPTPAIGRAYQEALRRGTYPSDFKEAYFLSNGAEYFAVIAEIFLTGPSFRPPYTCGAVRKAQPEFVRYLVTLFGERECR